MDARQQRTRTALSKAILKLAATRPVTEITVSELAAEAGINRSTFYEHSDSPVALLRSTLREELDVIRDRHLIDPTDISVAITDTTRDVLIHVESHEAIYARGLALDENAGELHSMLSAQFKQTTRRLLDDGEIILPESANPELLSATVPRYIADGTVGAIEAWLRRPAPRSHDAFLATYRVVLPDWWPIK